GTLGELLQAYCARLRDQAAGRLGDSLGLDLVQERAALAREQRIGQAIKNGVARKEYAPVGLLADVLGTASSAVVDRFDHLEGVLAKSCPDLPEDAKTAVLTVIADARNEWIKSTARLVDAAVDEMLADSDHDSMAADNAAPVDLTTDVEGSIT
nr:hypothetical protein [Acidovorax sp.]